MYVQKSYSVCTIVHPAFLRLLETHIISIEKAAIKIKNQLPIKILLSYAKSDNDKKYFKEILEKFPYMDIEYFTVDNRLTCAQARNFLFHKISTEWCIFFDADVILAVNYFVELNNILKDHKNLDNVKAFAGGMGTWGTSDWGYNEYLMDMYAYYGKAAGINVKKIDLANYVAFLNQKEPNYEKLNMLKTYYLQGYNQVIHSSMYLEHGGYDDSYFGAEDREMAARIYNLGYEIKLAPKMLVYHYFNFSRNDVCRRKYGHGYYSAKFRDKYRNLDIASYERGWIKWMKYFSTLILIPKTFRSWNKYKYYQWAFWTYLFGSIIYNAEKVTGLKLFKIFELGTEKKSSRITNRLIKSFNYSNYDFAKQNDK